MRAGPSSSTGESVRIYYIRAPEPTPSGEGFLALRIGILLLWLPIYVVTESGVDWIFEKLGRPTPWSLWAAAVVLSVIAPVAGILYIGWLAGGGPLKRRRRARLTRTDALSGVTEPPPDRGIELALRAGRTPSRRFASSLKRIPVGNIVLAESESHRLARQPATSAIPFEPIDLADDRERLAALRQMDHGKLARSPVLRKVRKMFKLTLPRFRQRPYYFLDIFAFCLCLAIAWASGCFLSGTWYSVLNTLRDLAVLDAAVASLFREDHWWLVPGGLICRRFRFWRKGVSVQLFTRADTPLFLEARDGTGLVLDEDRLRRFSYSKEDLPAVIAAWISRARTPSLEEVRAFVGQDSAPDSRTRAPSRTA